ncbi:MAG: bifunctional SulP family inorganic anion transporter/carbonic anhydrase, partial [Bacteroidia bacterium]|nr:bifunctional SulP family inorganic anion transporter/carbonic anhydrase [Bacteroidia bacterium]
DPEKRYSPPNNELKAQGIGNMLSGLIGGLPLTSVIVRSSVNINAGAKTKASSFFHGVLLLSSVALFPQLLNKIPLASLAAILLVTGYKLADPSVFKKIYAQGKHQFIPFAVTIVAVVFTDLLTGVLIGLGISIFSVLRVNYKNPYYYQLAKQNDKDIIKIELAQEVSFLNKANIQVTLNDLPENSTVIIDAHRTKYIDSDVTEIIKEFRDIKSPQKKIKSLLVGFDEASNLSNTKLFSPEETVLDPLQRTKVIQDKLTPSQAIHILKEGNYRFVNHLKINRNLLQQVNSTSDAQYPFAAILSCIDSRTSAELIFDQGLGDIFSIRIAGNTINDDILGSLEFSCSIAGAKVIVVLGHTNCGAIKGACDNVQTGYLKGLMSKLRIAVDAENTIVENRTSKNHLFVNTVAHINVKSTVKAITEKSSIINALIENKKVAIVGAMYDVESGRVNFYEDPNE